MKRKIPDHDLARYSRQHLLYELQLLHWTAAVMPYMQGPMSFALLESFVIHLRNLINFFHPERPQEDDVIAPDFFDDPAKWHERIPVSLALARERANKELSHLTLKRKSDEDPDKPWKVGELVKEIQIIAKAFAMAASEAKLHSDVRRFLDVAKKSGTDFRDASTATFT